MIKEGVENLVPDVVASGLAEFPVAVLFLGEADLFKNKVGDGMGEDGSNGQSGRLGLVATIGAGHELELKLFAIGMSEGDGSLLLDSTIVGGSYARLAANDAVAGLDVEAVSAGDIRVDNVFADGSGELLLLRDSLRSSGSEGEQGEGEDHLHVDGWCCCWMERVRV